jgi:CRISPR-associated protein Csb2
MSADICAKIDQLTRLWVAPKAAAAGTDGEDLGQREWRLALEGFGNPADFADASPLFGLARVWESVTPFLATGHLKADGYAGEVRRLLKRRGLADDRTAAQVAVEVIPEIMINGAPRRAIHFHRFRSRGAEKQPDAAGALLRLIFPKGALTSIVHGPLAMGYAAHFGLGLFRAVE